MRHVTDIDLPEDGDRRWRWLFLTFKAVVVFAALGLVFIMRGPSDETIEFVIPSDYRGLITLVKDAANGVEPVRKDKNVFVYEIPESGTLAVRSFRLFERWHTTRAEYADGRNVHVDMPSKLKENRMSMRAIGMKVTDREYEYYTVGSVDDHIAWQKRLGFWSEAAKPRPGANNP